ncbi:MAG: TetR/AcrR family transcriptional regulator [Myxococcales bacterium]
MPTVPKTSPESIVKAARRLVARGGAPGLSLQSVARAVGVQAPSLYKHFDDRTALLRAVAVEASRELAAAQLAAAGAEGPLERRLEAVARAQRDFARRQPHLYALVFDAHVRLERSPKDQQQLEALFALLAEWMGGGEEVLEGARLLTAFVHGFASMERAGAFQLGGDVDRAFDFGLKRVLRALKGR